MAEYADDVTILYAARVMEQAHAAELFRNPLNPYTRALLASIPGVGGIKRIAAAGDSRHDPERAKSAQRMPLSSALPAWRSTIARGSIRPWKQKRRTIMPPVSGSSSPMPADARAASAARHASVDCCAENLRKEFPAGGRGTVRARKR